MGKKIDSKVEQKVIDYVTKNYKNTYGKCKELIIEETDTLFKVLTHKDGSPLMLGKSILNS
jgi:hypothetical protein